MCRNLQPPLTESSEVRKAILDGCLPHLNMADDSKDAAEGKEEKSADPSPGRTPQQVSKRQASIAAILANLNNCLSSFVHMDPHVKSLTQLLEVSSRRQRRFARGRRLRSFVATLRRLCDRGYAERHFESKEFLTHSANGDRVPI